MVVKRLPNKFLSCNYVAYIKLRMVSFKKVKTFHHKSRVVIVFTLSSAWLEDRNEPVWMLVIDLALVDLRRNINYTHVISNFVVPNVFWRDVIIGVHVFVDLVELGQDKLFSKDDLRKACNRN